MIYKLLIDPLLNSSHTRAASLTMPGEKVLDVACGNGTLALMIARKNGGDVTGIDLDEAMLKQAEQTRKKAGAKSVRFIQADATDLSNFGNNEFNAAVISMAIHQFNPEEGLKVLKEMKRVAAKIIILDYAYPLNDGLYGWFVKAIEWLAGGEHNRNFRLYMKNGGIDTLLKQAELKVTERYDHGKGTLEVNLCNPTHKTKKS
jgi:ubiquinone/menaquinone biosynthesis C-methylase UbiE